MHPFACWHERADSTSARRLLQCRTMNREMPAYYSELAPFREVFESGHPVLTYHKLGPRPARVRLKGMYLGELLFRRQLEELRSAGYESGTLEACVGPRAGRRIAITFDDGYVNVLRHGLAALEATGFKAIQFLVADLLGECNRWDVAVGEAPEPMMDVAQVRDWLAAGHEIGSHTRTHPFLTRLPPAQAREEIVSSRKKLEDCFGRPVNHFCYPYGDWNEAVRDCVAEAGYQTACTTDAGINGPGASPLELKRFTARYPSMNLKAIWARWRWRLR
jgi:peptidoglycan/xylan/chitin deacetylase (PgdA/CDA1 family)